MRNSSPPNYLQMFVTITLCKIWELWYLSLICVAELVFVLLGDLPLVQQEQEGAD